MSAISRFLDGRGRLARIPSRPSRKLELASHIANEFSYGQFYSEYEVNDVLTAFHDDYISLRRMMIELGQLARASNGSAYWRVLGGE